MYSCLQLHFQRLAQWMVAMLEVVLISKLARNACSEICVALVFVMYMCPMHVLPPLVVWITRFESLKQLTVAKLIRPDCCCI
jgi:hypothetical protein